MQVEREIKFKLPPEAARRVARTVRAAGPWRRRTVSNAYFDTPQLRLQRAGAALRFRREGAKRLQTLKAEGGAHAGLSARPEWEIPAPHGKLDARAFPRTEVMAATGIDLQRLARQLHPVFETRFTRRSAAVVLDGAARAEICVDIGEVRAGGRQEPISELELELKAGDAVALLRYAEGLSRALGLELEFESKAERGYRLAAGRLYAPPRKWPKPVFAELATPGEAFASLAAASLSQAGANARGVIERSDPEYLHQLRVGLRRLRSVLRAFRPIIGKRNPALRRLRRLMPAFGAARDWDVFCEWLKDVPDSGELLARARARRSAARRKARQSAASPEFQVFLLRTLRWLHGAPWKRRARGIDGSLAAFGAQSLERLHRKAVKQASGIDWSDAAARHAVRIRVKRLRYACEFFASCFPRASARPYLKRLEILQDLLGELNDVAVARRLLQRLGGSGVVGRKLHERQNRLIRELQPAWAALEKGRSFWTAR